MSQFEISQSTPDDKFQIQVNADHRGKNGMAHTFYADVRIWSFAKSAHQIRSQRNQIIDFKQNIGTLLSSMQFLGGGTMKGVEYDLAMLDYDQANIQNDLNGIDIL